MTLGSIQRPCYLPSKHFVSENLITVVAFRICLLSCIGAITKSHQPGRCHRDDAKHCHAGGVNKDPEGISSDGGIGPGKAITRNCVAVGHGREMSCKPPRSLVSVQQVSLLTLLCDCI